MDKGSGRDRFAYLNQLSAEDLEALMRADLERTEGADGRTLRILEVMLEREDMKDETRRADTQRAFDEFQTYYNIPEGEGRSLYGAPEPDAAQPWPEAVPPSAPEPRRKTAMRRTLIAATVVTLVLAVTLIPVSGFKNLIHMAVYLTAEQLHIRIDGLAPEKRPTLSEEFQAWQKWLADHGVAQPVFPRLIPEGFKLLEAKRTEYPDDEKTDFTAVYLCEGDIITFFIVYENTPDERKYERDDNMVEEYTSGGVTHYLFSNNGTNTAYWSRDTLTCTIDTTLPISDLKQIVDSIYEE